MTTTTTAASSRIARPDAGFATSRAAGPSSRDRIGDETALAPLVVLLLDHHGAMAVAVERAARMSRALDAKLHVVLAIPRRLAATHPMLVVSHVTDLLRARSPRRGHELEVIHGDLAELGFEIARDESAALVIVDAAFGATEAVGEAACLAARLAAPVLVARDARVGGDWIAASDMQHLEFPVLSAARELGRALDRDVIYFHNATPITAFVGDPVMEVDTYAAMLRLQDDVAAAKRARLAHLSGTDDRIHSILTRAGSTVDVLVDVAREHDADVVVIGHSPRSWWQRLFGRGTVEELFEQTRRSVLIVPLDQKP